MSLVPFVVVWAPSTSASGQQALALLAHASVPRGRRSSVDAVVCRHLCRSWSASLRARHIGAGHHLAVVPDHGRWHPANNAGRIQGQE
eukprot:CAMPEP_0179445774 /NCGR_PEP_ID=MMETSP0799-20121207/29218_1 /TAXON_ID=46947 /ORGANISM="Geminigera cryophila, Strain CCMP2564" /LENGTH=87 /DNA_ID=CAMNT_0021234149 /DNA_START=958 /DNA_END=1221 /DNA_ORIENTATION=-